MPIRISKNRVALENIPLNLAQELDVASATTTNIGAALSNNLKITGTTTITAFDNVTPGIIRFLRFDGALTLTHNGTSLILPGAANITTAAGDSALAVSLGSGNWKVHFYQKASGMSVVSSSNKNTIINGNFDIWQRGTSFTINSASTSNVYTADRWCANPGPGGGPGTCTVSRQVFTVGQTDVPNEPTYFLRWDQTVAGTSFVNLFHRIEDVRTYANKQITFNFYAKVSSGTLSVTPTIYQNFGSGGSTAVTTTGTAFTLTTSWQRFTQTISVPSISGKTVGTSSYLQFAFNFPTGATFTADIAQAQLEEGSTATAFEYRPIGQELLLCQRYYEKSSNLDTDVSTVEGFVGLASGAANFRWFVPFRVRKRAAPTVTTYNSSLPGSTTTLRNYTAVSNETYSSISAQESFYFLYHNASTSNNMYTWSWVADAEP